MSKGHQPTADDDLELTLETLDHWETELDEFAAGIMQRLSGVSGRPIDTSELIPPGDFHGSNAESPAEEVHEEQEAMQLLQTLRDMTQ